VVGEDNYVHAIIWNLGAKLAAPVEVDFYWANPSLGFSSGDCNYIGSEHLQVTTRTYVDVRCNKPWRPIELNGGHECLLVNCSNYILNPIRHPFEPQLDRRVGQHNVTVVSAYASEPVTLQVNLTNLFPIATSAEVFARVEHVTLDASDLQNLGQREAINQIMGYGAATASMAGIATRYATGTAEAHLARRISRGACQEAPPPSTVVRSVADQRSSTSVQATLACEGSFVPRSNPGQLLADLLLAADKLADPVSGAGPQLRVMEASLQPFEQRSLDLKFSVPGNSKQGDFLVFHLTHTAQGLTVGGYTVIIRVI
jgi:hypothetical protein